MSKRTRKAKKKRQNTPKNSVNLHHKDRLFRYLFRDRKHLLDLYNALNGTSYQNEKELTITTLEGVIYMGMKNDLSFMVDSVMSLYEHQSTWNPNMPLRGLLYFAKLYQVYVKEQGYDLSGNRRIPLPVPQYIVFYNGVREMPDQSEQLLSQAFAQSSGSSLETAGLECRVRMININQGRNQELLEKCRRLWEYAELIGRIRHNQAQGMNLKEAVDAAVDSCIREEILADILLSSKVEVTDMLLEEYNEKETRRYLQREAWEEGKKEGIKQGIHAGMESKLVEQVCRKLRKGKEAEAIAEELEEDLHVIRKICQAALEFAPDYDNGLVFDKLFKK
ncbi:MAG: Rpn family recombination-promoting nuclease/putative transposase [Lachnospiraceae bacterium]|nr:Rpn family recombination-promoting nuclease/putative transposase [Lachnospiraceae bacterium]